MLAHSPNSTALKGSPRTIEEIQAELEVGPNLDE